jgi:hypothetical protein
MVGFPWNHFQTIRNWILYRLHVCIALQWPFLTELWLRFRELFTLLCVSGIFNPTETFCNLEYGFKKKYKIVCQIQYKQTKFYFHFCFFDKHTLFHSRFYELRTTCRWTADNHCFCNKIANNGRIPMKPVANDPQFNSIPFACVHCPPMTIFERVVAPLPRVFYTFVWKWDFKSNWNILQFRIWFQ